MLAAGAGRRLRPVTLSRSKATVPVVGRPMITWVLDSLAAAGADDFVVVVQAVGDDVTECCMAWADGRPIRFAMQPERLGMAHALLQAVPWLTGSFVMSACDSLVPDEVVAELVRAHRARGAAATLTVQRVARREDLRKTGVVTLNGDLIGGIVEKPEPDEAPSDLASLPLYVFEPELLDHLSGVQRSPRGEYELQDAIAALIAEGRPVAPFTVTRRWQVTGTDDLLAINRAFLDRGRRRPDPRAECRGPVYVAPGAKLADRVVVGPYAVLEDGCRIETGATIREAVVLKGAVVAAGATVAGRVVTPEPE